jgi:hypothetical protein
MQMIMYNTKFQFFTYEGYNMEQATNFGTLKAINFTIAQLHTDDTQGCKI